jgi:hypothetical protein
MRSDTPVTSAQDPQTTRASARPVKRQAQGLFKNRYGAAETKAPPATRGASELGAVQGISGSARLLAPTAIDSGRRHGSG